MRSASSDQDIEGRGCVVIDVNREIKGVSDAALTGAYQPSERSVPVENPLAFVLKNSVRVAGSTGMRPEIVNGRALTAMTFAMLVCRRASLA
jgi:hypothetical protein